MNPAERLNGIITKAEQLEHQLAVQARQIEAVFRSYDQAVSAAEGVMNGRWAIFDLSPPIWLSPADVMELQRQLMLALKVPAVRLYAADQRPRVVVLQPPADPVPLLDLLAALPGLSPATAVLGVADQGRPVLLNLASGRVTNILLSGTAGCGKASLIRTLFVSLALQSRQSGVQLVAVTYGPDGHPSAAPGSELYPLGLLPHMAAPILIGLEDIMAFLGHLIKEVRFRLEQGIRRPLMIVAMGDLQELLTDGGRPFGERLARLLQAGPEAGIRFILSGRDAQAAEIQKLIRGNVTVRLSGRQPDARAAWAATGGPDSGAEYLPGSGRFIALSAGTAVSFQPATISDYSLHLTLERLHRQYGRAMVPPAVVNRLPDPLSVSSQLAL